MHRRTVHLEETSTLLRLSPTHRILLTPSLHSPRHPHDPGTTIGQSVDKSLVQQTPSLFLLLHPHQYHLNNQHPLQHQHHLHLIIPQHHLRPSLQAQDPSLLHQRPRQLHHHRQQESHEQNLIVFLYPFSTGATEPRNSPVSLHPPPPIPLTTFHLLHPLLYHHRNPSPKTTSPIPSYPKRKNFKSQPSLSTLTMKMANLQGSSLNRISNISPPCPLSPFDP